MRPGVLIKQLKLSFITKQNNYTNEQVCFKIKENSVENQYITINKDGHNLPYFKSKDRTYSLKVKSKYVRLVDELDNDLVHMCDLDLKYYYSMGGVEGGTGGGHPRVLLGARGFEVAFLKRRSFSRPPPTP